ncbi:MAG TPA: hypothetical protein PKD96_03170, partial [Candidatus Absconditabacterales bacterium]|nr:hypothetical protein [Candidatus Absconditabacterales bacterium]
CKLGTRPLDSLIQNMIDIGADYKHENGNYYLSIDQSKISGKEIRSRFPSVTGTENLIIFATKIQGTTIIYNAACEPHTQELCHFLNAMGANISGIGSNKIIIEGVGHLKGVEWTVDSDHLDVGGFIAATVMTGGELTIKNAVVKHMDMILQVYKKLGVTVEIDRAKDEIFVPKNQKLVIDKTVKGDLFDIKALHRPLFPADLIHVASVLALKAQGSAIFINSFYEYSFFFVEELAKMKALTVMADPMRIITFGPTQFKPANLISPNIIQASYAMVICALAAEGKSVISEVEPLFRRYPDIDKQFNSIGADIEIIRE